MMQTMRHLAQTQVFKGLMLILIISFSIWGIGDIFRGNPLQETVAQVGDVKISVQMLNRSFEQELTRARQSFGPELTAQQAKQLGILDSTLNTMVQRAAIDQDIKRLGLDVNNKTVMEKIAAEPGLRDKNGKLNKELLQQVIAQSHMSEKDFIEQGRQEMARLMIAAVFKTDNKAPQMIIDSLYKARAQKRILDVISFKNDSISDIPTPEDKTLEEFYQQNIKKFTAPEYRTMTVARLSTETLSKEIAITDDQLKKEYDQKSEQLSQPERRDLLQVVVQDEAKAKQLMVAAKASSNLTTSAKNMGLEAVALNLSDEKSLLPELAKPVFSLQRKQISEPIKSSLGWHIIQVQEIVPAGKPDFKDIKNDLKEAMQRDQAIESVTRTINQLDDELAAGHALEDIADSLKLRIIKTTPLDMNGLTTDGKEPAELPNKEDVLKSGYAQNIGETSPVLDDKNGNYYVVRTDDITPSAAKPFASVKDQVVKAWLATEQVKRASAEAKKIEQDIRDGKTPASFASRKGAEVWTSKPISLLGDKDPQIPDALGPQILKLKKGEVVAMPFGNQQFILRLAEIVDTAETNDTAKNQIRDELNTRAPNEAVDQYVKYLRSVFPVRIHQDVLESVRQQGSVL